MKPSDLTYEKAKAMQIILAAGRREYDIYTCLAAVENNITPLLVTDEQRAAAKLNFFRNTHN